MKKYFAMAAAALALVACDKNNDDLGIDNTKDSPITILSAGVADLSTRAGTPAGTLTSGSLSFFFNNNSGDNARYVADCEKWTYKNGKWQFDETGTDPQQLLWKGAGNAIPWIATYPYRGHQYSHITDASIGGMEEQVPADQTDKAKWNGFDVPDNEIDKLVDALGISMAEAAELWLTDNGKMVNEDQEKANAEAAHNKRRYEQGEKPRKKVVKERKVDENKRDLLEIIQKALENSGNCTDFVQNNEVDLHFKAFGDDFTVKLTKHRKKK